MPTFRNTLCVPSSYLHAYEDGTECSETSAYKIHTPGNYPEESIQPFYRHFTMVYMSFEEQPRVCGYRRWWNRKFFLTMSFLFLFLGSNKNINTTFHKEMSVDQANVTNSESVTSKYLIGIAVPGSNVPPKFWLGGC
jgi:hypothetical protein